jgi:hypothetical protein
MIPSVTRWISAMIAMKFQVESVDCLAIEVFDNVIRCGRGVDLNDGVIFDAVRLQVFDADDFGTFNDVPSEEGGQAELGFKAFQRHFIDFVDGGAKRQMFVKDPHNGSR